MSGISAAARIACGGLVLAHLAAHGMTPAHAQESAEALIQRLQQIQGQLGPGAARSVQEQPAPADQLIRRIEAIRQQSAAEAAGRAPALAEEEVRRLVSEGLGVDVLRAELLERDGQPVYALTVMNPPGNYNGALQVTTVLVDGATGGLLGEVPHTPRAADSELSASAPAVGFDGSGPEIRRRTHR